MPITYSSLSITGWVYYFFVEIISLFIAKKYFDISIKNILIVSSTYMLLECSFSFTLGFFIMETLHRKIFLQTHKRVRKNLYELSEVKA